ncbi:protein translocase subunit SecD [Roseburia sp. 499]|uniref:protein translocase subunit SecD n=1 Tax=Roseburia sp. 499 TaxID=1261634 RepID=UPI0009524E71|nr:protein translocase subunit SecD [Roseburia sp. 499]WVK70622.1 protein translocase subunit SecD [Roseburia sp. 499]
MKKSRAMGILVLILAILAGMTWYAGTIISTVGVGENRNIKLGLDLAGGVSITYEAVEEKPSAEDMKDTVYKLQKRVEKYSTEASVYQEGSNRISIEIPGVSDANTILEEMGKPGSLEFQTSAGETILDGNDIKDAQPETYTDEQGRRQNVVSLTLTEEGTKKFAEATEANLGKQIPIVYDGETISSPNVQSVISDGNAQITGMESYEAADELASTIRIGSLSLELEELNSKVVGAQLGTSAMSSSLLAAAIGLAVVILFMIVMYRIQGFASGIALILYSALMVWALWIFDITLTLPGIAGIILSIGMAVDANVIIFARIQEEIAAGKAVGTAMKIGYDKALSAIVDGNVTTLIAAVVLGLRGSGPVKGFAYTLGIGIVLSMFTALVVTRWLMKCFYALGAKSEKLYGKKPERKTINFLGKRAVFFTVSIALIAAGFIGMGVHNANGNKVLNFSLDFVGGTSTTAEFSKEYSIAEIDKEIVPVIENLTGDKNVQTQKIKESNQIVIKTRSLNLEEREALNDTLAEKFGVDKETITSENISSTISSEMKSDAVWAVAIATICMLIYIWFRFKDIRFAGSAVLALVHDVLVVLAFYAVARVSVGNTFIACMLTIVGYSVNATIVIFDRIRENLPVLRDQNEENLLEVANKSITQTLSRSINTSLTTFVMVALLFVLGVNSVKEFALPLMVGIICGTYSSICITGALWYTFRVKFKKKEK